MLRAYIWAIAVFLSATSHLVQAQSITWEFDAAITRVTGPDTGSVAGASFGSFSFSAGLIDNDPVPNFARYFPITTERLAGFLPAAGFSPFDDFIRIFNLPNGDLYEVQGHAFNPNFSQVTWSITLFDPTGTALSSDSLLLSPPSLSAFATASFDIEAILLPEFGGERVTASGPLTRLDLVTAPIPEPETYAMLLAGLLLLSIEARRRKHPLRAAT